MLTALLPHPCSRVEETLEITEVVRAELQTVNSEYEDMLRESVPEWMLKPLVLVREKNEKLLDEIVRRHGRMVARRGTVVESLRAQAAALEQAAGPKLPSSDDLADCAADTAYKWAEQVRGQVCATFEVLDVRQAPTQGLPVKWHVALVELLQLLLLLLLLLLQEGAASVEQLEQKLASEMALVNNPVSAVWSQAVLCLGSSLAMAWLGEAGGWDAYRLLHPLLPPEGGGDLAALATTWAAWTAPFLFGTLAAYAAAPSSVTKWCVWGLGDMDGWMRGEGMSVTVALSINPCDAFFPMDVPVCPLASQRALLPCPSALSNNRPVCPSPLPPPPRLGAASCEWWTKTSSSR